MWLRRCWQASRKRNTSFDAVPKPRERWSLWQARPCSWNVVYWNSTSSSSNSFPKTLSQPTVSRPWLQGPFPGSRLKHEHQSKFKLWKKASLAIVVGKAPLQTITWSKSCSNVPGKVPPTLTHNVTRVINITYQPIFYIWNLHLA